MKTNPSLFFFFFYFFLSVFFSFCLHLSLSQGPHNPEVEALIAIKKELQDPNGVFTNWDPYSPDPCTWGFITCSSNGFVTALGAPNQSLSGKLSGAIANLTNLEQVLLQNNNISGKIPPEIGSLLKLQSLDLNNNRFSGSIPSSFGHLESLHYMRFHNNALSGPIPASLANLSQLILLDLSYNNLSGPVPRLPATISVAGNPFIGSKGAEESSVPEGQALKSSSPSSLPSKARYILWFVWLGIVLVA